jgi:serine/threonine protein kinase
VPDPPLTNQAPRSPFAAGRLIAGRYRLDHLIASGGMAEVWQAADTVLGRPVAVKILHPHLAADDTFVVRFRTEAVAAARLHHPGIVAIYDTCHDQGSEAIVMELVRGPTLRARLDDQHFLSPDEVVRIGAQVADALGAAHRAGLVHRDIKPANILLCEDGRVMVTDFGIAKIRDDPDVTQTGTMLGTVKYLAPEQVRGERLDGRADIYALGVVLYEALCARPPFAGDTPAATALARLHQTPPRPRQVRTTIPAALDDIVMRCLRLDPAGRYPAAEDLRAALLEPATTRESDDLTVSTPRDQTTTWATGAPVGPTMPAPVRAPTGPATPVTSRAVVLVEPRSHAAWLRPTLATVFVVGALVLAGVLIDRTSAGRQFFDWARRSTSQTTVTSTTEPPTGAAIPIASVQSFDPGGRGDPGENDNRLALAIDGDPHTGWVTDSYNERTFGFKTGVGIVAVLGQSTELGHISVTSPTRGWAATVYIADRPRATLADWGDPVDQRSGIDGNATFDLGHHHGSAVLIWITDLGDGPPRVRAEIDDLTVHG